MASSSSTFASGGSPTQAQVNGWAQGLLGYAQVTANQTGITTEVDITGLSVTVTVVANRRIRITGEIYASSTVNDDAAAMRIKESTTQLQQADSVLRVATQKIIGNVILTPSAGSHTYKLTIVRATGTGTLTMAAGATFPAYILVEDIGAV